MGKMVESKRSHIITTDDVVQKKDRRAELLREVATIDEWLRALAIVAPELSQAGGDVAVAPPGTPGTSSRQTAPAGGASKWRAAITHALLEKGAGLTPAGLWDAIKAGPHGNTIKKSNSLYVQLGVLADAGLVVKHGKSFFAKRVYDDLAASNRLPPVEEGVTERVNS